MRGGYVTPQDGDKRGGYVTLRGGDKRGGYADPLEDPEYSGSGWVREDSQHNNVLPGISFLQNFLYFRYRIKINSMYFHTTDPAKAEKLMSRRHQNISR